MDISKEVAKQIIDLGVSLFVITGIFAIFSFKVKKQRRKVFWVTIFYTVLFLVAGVVFLRSAYGCRSTDAICTAGKVFGGTFIFLGYSDILFFLFVTITLKRLKHKLSKLNLRLGEKLERQYANGIVAFVISTWISVPYILWVYGNVSKQLNILISNNKNRKEKEKALDDLNWALSKKVKINKRGKISTKKRPH